MKNKQAIYWVILVAVLAALLVSFYVLQRNRGSPMGERSSDLATIRAYLDDTAPSVNTSLAHEVMDRAVAAQTDGNLGDEAIEQMDAVMEAAAADRVIMDHELLQLADIVGRESYDHPIRSRGDVRKLLSQ